MINLVDAVLHSNSCIRICYEPSPGIQQRWLLAGEYLRPVHWQTAVGLQITKRKQCHHNTCCKTLTYYPCVHHTGYWLHWNWLHVDCSITAYYITGSQDIPPKAQLPTKTCAWLCRMHWRTILSRVLAGGALEQVESYCYLGVLMSSRLT